MQDDESGIPMSGEDGKLLSKMLQAISLSEDTNTYITPIIKCRPPENKLPLLEQMYACKTFWIFKYKNATALYPCAWKPYKPLPPWSKNKTFKIFVVRFLTISFIPTKALPCL